MKRCKRLAFAFGLVLLAASDISGAVTNTLVAPNANENVPAGGGEFGFIADGTRILGVYNSTEFLGDMPLGGVIHQIAFRVDESITRPLDFVIPDLEVRLSTSSSVAPFVPPVFAE